MADVQKPVTETPAAAEPVEAVPAVTETPAVTEPATTTTDATAVPATTEPATTEPAAEASTEAAAPAATDKAAEKKPAEPIYSGTLGYKAPGLVKGLIFSKRYFWFGEEPVPAEKLSVFLRGEKPDVGHHTAAWSSQTGKGLLYFAKQKQHDEKATEKPSPAGILCLADASDVLSEAINEFSVKINDHKHSFQAKTPAERDGWFTALKAAIDEAKASAEGIKTSEGYKGALEKLSKPTFAAGAAAGASSSKKSTEVKPTEGAAAADNASSVSSSDEDKKKKKKEKAKSRSVSRGKRGSIFGALLGKKEELEEKKEAKKEEKEEAKVTEGEASTATETPAVVAAPTTETTAAEPAPVVAPTEEIKPAETTPAVAAAETKPDTPVEASSSTTEPAKPKPSKRSSIFGSVFQKVRSPTSEKKESEVAPIVPPKDTAKETETPTADTTVTPAVAPAATETTEAPVATETPAVTEATPATPATPVADAKPAATPQKEKESFSFGKFLGAAREKVRSPSSEQKAPPAAATAAEPSTAAKTEETAVAAPAAETTEAPAAVEPVAPVVPAADTEATLKAEEVKAEEAKPEAAASSSATPELKEKRRSSFFGNLTGSMKKDKTESDSEKPSSSSKLGGLFRNPSKAIKSRKEKEPIAEPKAEEPVAETKEVPAEPSAAAGSSSAAPVKTEGEITSEKTEPKAIGDVVPDAVTVGSAPSTNPVQAAA